LDGGSRTFTIFDKEGNVVYTSGTEVDDWAARLGHYQEGRSENKGSEPETVKYYEFNGEPLLFVNMERASLIFVYDVSDVTAPALKQILNSGGVGPEGTFGIPSRNLIVFANEVDARDTVIRGSVSIFEYSTADAVYPTIVSAEGPDGKYIPFGALSGLAADDTMLYTMEDSIYKSSRIFAIDTTMTPPTIVEAMRVTDANGVFAAILGDLEATIPGVTASMLNEDGTVNLDMEGIDVVDGGFWVVSEGSGTVGDEERPVESLNLLIKLDAGAVIEEVILLPDDVNAIQVRYGFEGVAVDGDNIVVTFQREWGDETMVRLGIYNTASAAWTFAMYPLDAYASQYADGWVGLSDIESLGDGVFYVVERDNQGGPGTCSCCLSCIKVVYRTRCIC
jgi:Esterase-like activity of phytase